MAMIRFDARAQMIIFVTGFVTGLSANAGRSVGRGDGELKC
jgi:hypothetical protein